MPTFGLFMICAIQAERSRGTIQKASPSHSCHVGVMYGTPFSSMVAIRATTGPARNSSISAGVGFWFLPIHSGGCLSAISTSLSLCRYRLTGRQLYLFGTRPPYHHVQNGVIDRQTVGPTAPIDPSDPHRLTFASLAWSAPHLVAQQKSKICGRGNMKRSLLALWLAPALFAGFAIVQTVAPPAAGANCVKGEHKPPYKLGWANIYSVPTWMKETTGTIEAMADELKKQGLVDKLTITDPQGKAT